MTANGPTLGLPRLAGTSFVVLAGSCVAGDAEPGVPSVGDDAAGDVSDVEFGSADVEGSVVAGGPDGEALALMVGLAVGFVDGEVVVGLGDDDPVTVARAEVTIGGRLPDDDELGVVEEGREVVVPVGCGTGCVGCGCWKLETGGCGHAESYATPVS